MRKSGLMLVPLAWLAACSEAEEAPAPQPGFTPSAASAASPAAAPAAAAPIAAAIPAAYVGAWDWTGGTCNANSDLRLDIASGEITFYESLGKVTAVREQDGGIAIDLAMEGEGEHWVQTTRLRLIEGGTMIESEHEDPSGEGPLRYRKCPAGTAQ